jgi:hypothetical protein
MGRKQTWSEGGSAQTRTALLRNGFPNFHEDSTSQNSDERYIVHPSKTFKLIELHDFTAMRLLAKIQFRPSSSFESSCTVLCPEKKRTLYKMLTAYNNHARKVISLI